MIEARGEGAPRAGGRLVEIIDGYYAFVIGEPVRLKYAHDCIACPDCGEPYCVECEVHYADCSCPGPASEIEDGWLVVDDLAYPLSPERSDS